MIVRQEFFDSERKGRINRAMTMKSRYMALAPGKQRPRAGSPTMEAIQIQYSVLD